MSSTDARISPKKVETIEIAETPETAIYKSQVIGKDSETKLRIPSCSLDKDPDQISEPLDPDEAAEKKRVEEHRAMMERFK